MPLAGTSVPSTRRKNVGQCLRRLSTLDDDSDEVKKFFEVEEAKRMADASVGFRYKAKSTQQRQDLVLEHYRDYIAACNRLNRKEAQDGEIDKLAFPPRDPQHEFKNLARQLKQFIMHIIPQMATRSMSDEALVYGVLIQHQAALIFWARRKYRMLHLGQPTVAELFTGIAEGMRYTAKQLDMRMKRETKPKSYLGSPELRQIMEMDARDTPNIMNAEGHHFGWIVARICAVRPDALGAPPDYKIPESHHDKAARDKLPYLSFGDVVVKRGQRAREFVMALTIRNPKSELKRERTEVIGQLRSKVRFYIKTPQKSTNLGFSVPYRFLVIALRRGALKHHTTIDELLSGDERHIMIKDEFLHKTSVLT